MGGMISEEGETESGGSTPASPYISVENTVQHIHITLIHIANNNTIVTRLRDIQGSSKQDLLFEVSYSTKHEQIIP